MLPIDLSYLVTPWGKTPEDEHQILGIVLQALYDNSELGFGSLTGDSWLPDDSVQLVLETLPIEGHFCIWDTVGMPYRLSATYRAQIIGIAPAVVETAPIGRAAPILDLGQGQIANGHEPLGLLHALTKPPLVRRLAGRYSKRSRKVIIISRRIRSHRRA